MNKPKKKQEKCQRCGGKLDKNKSYCPHCYSQDPYLHYPDCKEL